MPELLPYNREAAVAYAHRWAYFRNPAYFDYSGIGGDCTNFVSQCVFAGAGVMNFTPTYGWFYRGPDDRTPSWTGVPFFYDFLTANRGAGPFASEVPLSLVEPGDPVQLAIGREQYGHTPVVVRIDGAPRPETVLVAAHSYDCDCRPLSSYNIWRIRCLHIEGVRP